MPDEQSIERVAVVGGGLMGSGIAEVCARADLDVVLVEQDSEAAAAAKLALESSIEEAVQRAKLSPERAEAALGRVVASDDLADVEGCNAVIEAVVENEDVKREVFAELDSRLPDAKFLATNTSSVPITKIAAATRRPESVLGLHFFNPAPVMPLVEVVNSIVTAPETLEAGREFVTGRLGKDTIDSQDRPGFVVNALLVPFLLSAIRMYESGFASRESIDRGMILGCAHPMGPLALSDLIGLDTLVAVAESLYEQSRDPAAVVPPIVNRMVESKQLGRKSGRGFYDYD
ncbi:MAG: 3-hydroxybutyryl-CoA dehydrogenase [Gemmatimonas sp.]|nr:3-hydroxybutyryl-CoA dehydrogenase [Gemmatimonas sp.]